MGEEYTIINGLFAVTCHISSFLTSCINGWKRLKVVFKKHTWFIW